MPTPSAHTEKPATTEGPMIDGDTTLREVLRTRLGLGARIYRAIVPARLRQLVRDAAPYEKNLSRAIRFWLSPRKRRLVKAELERCQTLDDYFAFASTHLGHQQWKQEIFGVLEFVNEHKPVRMCELGTFLGGTNLMLSRCLPTAKLLIGVDMFLRNKFKLNYFARSDCKQVFVKGLTCDKSTIEQVERALGGEKLDLLFIDADHSYEGSKRDFLAYRHFVRDGGLIVFHDIVQDHLTRYRYDPKEWNGARSGEVYRVWQEVKPFYETKEFVIDYEQDGCGIGVIIYSPDVVIPDDF